jgi:hypothetical protein
MDSIRGTANGEQREPGTGNREPEDEKREQGTGNREQGRKKRHPRRCGYACLDPYASLFVSRLLSKP